MTDIPVHLEQIFRYASLAPNSYNCQPWRIKLVPGSGVEWVVQSDSSRWLPYCDPANHGLLLSIGAFWENLILAANALGYEVHTKIMASRPIDTDILKMKLVEHPESKDRPPGMSQMLDLMENRFTNHRMYKKTPLSPFHLEECQTLLPGSIAFFSRESEKGKWIAGNQVDAMKQQVFNDMKQEELAKWTRFSPSLAVQRGDGVTAEMAGFSGLTKFLCHAFMTPERLLSDTVRIQTVKWMKKRITRCAGFFAITSEDNSVSSLLQAGRVMEQLELKCTQLNIQVSTISQLINESPWNQDLTVKLGLENPVQMIMIAGYSDNRPKIIRIRRPVKDFVFHHP